MLKVAFFRTPHVSGDLTLHKPLAQESSLQDQLQGRSAGTPIV